jgi:hypothetical protein
MADITPQPDGSAQIAVSQGESAGLKALAKTHLPALQRAISWFDADVAPELSQAADFLKSLAASPPEGSTLTVSASEAQTLRGLLTTHIPDFQQVLAVVESPVVRDLLVFARALL